MRFLHTSDWHLGRQIRALSRQDEFVAVLEEVVTIARDERVDAAIIAGDIFDTFSPPAEAEQLFYQTLERLLAEGIAVVMLAGNHDHAPRMDALSGLLRLAGVNSIGSIPARAESTHINVRSRDGEESATIAALPWYPERHLLEFETLARGPEAPLQQYSDRVERAINSVCAGLPDDQVKIFAGHILVDGAAIGEGSGERKLHVGQNFALKSHCLPASAQYIALGHVHRPQEIVCAAPARYSGSLLQLDFGETGQQKSVTIVDASPRLPAQVRTIDLQAGRRLRSVTIPLAELAAHAGRYGDDYLRVTIELTEAVRDLYQTVREVLPHAVDVSAVPLAEEDKPKSAAEHKGLAPDELFARYYRSRYNLDAPEDLLAAFRSLYAEVEHASR